MERSKVPPNMFWSDRAKEEHRLVEQRPGDLPSPESLPPVTDGGRYPTGKGRGGTTAVGVDGDGDLGAGAMGCYTTPPSNRGPGSLHEGDYASAGVYDGYAQSRPYATQGLMTDEDVEVAVKIRRTEGSVPENQPKVPAGHGEKVSQPPNELRREQPPDELQRELERAMVEDLKEQNAQLQMELQQLRSRQMVGDQVDSSASSWTVVSGTQGARTRGRSECRTPRRLAHRTLEPNPPRFTPNGTQVPPDTPSTGRDPVPPPMVPLPPVPPMPAAPQDDADVSAYDPHHVSGRGALKGDRVWVTSQPRTMTPHEARAAWLEREVKVLQAALDEQKGTPMFRESHVSQQGTIGDSSAGAALDSSSRYRDDHGRSGEPPDTRADRSAVLGEVLHQDRAATLRGEVLHQDRASATAALGVESHQGRASICRHGDVWQPVRAARGEPLLQGRAVAAELSSGGDDYGTVPSLMSANPAAINQAAREINERDDYNRKVEQLTKAEGGYGFGYPGATSALDPRSPYWIPPPNGGREIELVNDDNDAAAMRSSGDRAMVAWEGGSNNKIELPELPADATPLSLGDWLTVITPLMRDVSQVSAIWWERTKSRAMELYNVWKQLTPLDRVGLTPVLPRELQEARFQRTEQRGTSLLLRAIPTDQQQAIVAAREMNSTAILFRLLIRFQPGGSGEKTLLLQKLTKLDDSTDMVGLTAAVRSWRRHYQRAVEVGAVVPDGTLLLHALEAGIQQIALKDSQATFRLAQARSQLGVDEQPSQDRVWRLSQCILAEAETLSLMSSSASSTPVPATPVTPIKVKQIDAPTPTTPSTEPSTTGKPRTPAAETPCKWFRSDNGCRVGSRCKFNHSWEGITDKSERCWICGSKQHRKAECALRAQSTSKGDPGSGSGGGGSGRGRGGDGGGSKDGKDGRPGGDKDGRGAGGRGNGKGGKGEASATSADSGPANNKSNEQPKVKEMSASEDVGQTQAAAEKSGKPGAGDLLMEATNLLRSLRMPATLKVMKVTSCDQSKDHVLLDSGATHGLRPARSVTEWDKATPVTVTLADGATSSLRLKWGTRILLSEPTTADGASSWIIPMGGLASMQYRLDWTEGGCRLYDPRGQEVPVELQGGCPVITMEAGRALLDEMEKHQLGQTHRLMMIKALVTNVEAVNPDCMTLDMAMLVKLKEVFPELPEAVMERVVPSYDEATMASPGDSLPWNRRKRRRLQRVKNIVLHFYSGDCGYQWEKMLNTKDTEVLCLDLLAPTPSNMLSPHVFWYVMGLATSGRVRAILGGPPCRTVSALRYQGDEGPGILRSDEFPYGLPELEPRDAELVLQDTTLWARMLLAYVLCEDARMDLDPEGPQTAFVMEQPEDPARYRSQVDIEKHHYFSMWRTAEWRAFQDRYNVSLIHFDQCTMGHKIKKPTTLGVVMGELQTLDGMRGNPEGGNDNTARSQMSMKERCAQSKQWAAWAPGLKAAIAEGVVRHLQRRPHRRVEHAEAYTLSMDLTGKLDVGKDQENETVHYLLVAVYTFPTTRDGKSLVPLPGHSEEDHPLPPLNEEAPQGEEMPGGIPGEDVAADVADVAAADVEPQPLDADENIFNEELEVDEEPTGADAIRVEAMEAALNTWEKLIQESKNVSDTSSGGRVASLGHGQNRTTAGALIMVSSLMVAEAHDIHEQESDLWWASAMVLMALGVVFVGQLTVKGTQACLRRLRAHRCGVGAGEEESAESADEMFHVVDDSSEENEVLMTELRSATRSSTTKTTNDRSLRKRSTSMNLTSPSGSQPLGQSSTSMNLTSQSGSQPLGQSSTSKTLTSQSGSQSRGQSSMSMNSTSQSGSCKGSSTSMKRLTWQGPESSMATSLEMPTRSGDQPSDQQQQPSTETERAFNDGFVEAQSAASSSKGGTKRNPWNEFQKANKGKGWYPTHMAKMYREQKYEMP
eukprot:Skav218289  [mRNA]  locus=scaffold2035:794479:803242:+ [translate_table: standard]